MTDSPAVLHVGGFVHADGQLDLQVGVLAVLGDRHPVELGLLWAGGGRTEDHLRDSSRVRTAASVRGQQGALPPREGPFRQPEEKKPKPTFSLSGGGANRR